MENEDNQEERTTYEKAKAVFYIAAQFFYTQLTECSVQGKAHGSRSRNAQAEITAFNDSDRIGYDDKADEAEH